MVILDTCAIIELCESKPIFSDKILHLISQGAYLLSISFAEIACKIKIGKLEIKISAHDLYKEYKKIETMKIVDIGVIEWLESIDLVWKENKDPADRMIVGFAHKKRIPIVTNDETITDFYNKVIWK